MLAKIMVISEISNAVYPREIVRFREADFDARNQLRLDQARLQSEAAAVAARRAGATPTPTPVNVDSDSTVESRVAEADSPRSSAASMHVAAGEHFLFDATAARLDLQAESSQQPVAEPVIVEEPQVPEVLQTARNLDDLTLADARVFEHALVVPVAIFELAGQHYRYLTSPNAVEAAGRIFRSRDASEHQDSVGSDRFSRQPVPSVATTENSAASYQLVFDSAESAGRNSLNAVA